MTSPRLVLLALMLPFCVASLGIASHAPSKPATLSNSQSTTTIAFQPATAYPSCATPYALDSGDLNQDGIPDVVLACREVGQVQAMLGTANGGLQALSSMPSGGSSPRSVKLADLNGDGRLDLVVANTNSAQVSVRLGTGTGSFGGSTAYPSGSSPYALALGDVNNDGRVDAVVSNYTTNQVSVLIGTGSGGFNPPVSYTVGANPYAVALADLNQDGRLDIAATNEGNNTVSILLGTGNGLFGTPSSFATQSHPQWVELKDLNGDGQLDMVVANGLDDNVSVFLGTGNGSFGIPNHYPVIDNPIAIAVGDLDNNQSPDLVVSNWYSTDASILVGNGDGTFQSSIALPAGTQQQLNSGILIDLNRDGRLDFVVNSFHYLSTSVRVLLNLTGVPTPTPTNTPSNTPTSTPTNTPTSTPTSTPIRTIGDYGVTINNGALYSNRISVTLSLIAPEDTMEMQISGDGGFQGAIWEPYRPTRAWGLTRYWDYVIPRTVYVRYKDSQGQVWGTFQDDILLDETPPHGWGHIHSQNGGQAMLSLEATDDVSGVADMRLSSRPDFVGSAWEAYAATHQWNFADGDTIYIQFRDHAGNQSETALLERSQVFVPSVIRPEP